MHRTPLTKQLKQTPYSSSVERYHVDLPREPNRVPTAPLKSRQKGLALAVNEVSGLGKERLSVLVDKMKQQSFTTKQKSKVEIVSLPKTDTKFRDTVGTEMHHRHLQDSKRPQTSKCSRRKDKQYDSEYHEEDNEDLIVVTGFKAELQQEPKKKHVTTRAIYSAQPKKSRMKPIDDLIKYNGSCVKKHGMQHTTHFQTSLGAEFLGLFANN